MENNTVYEWLLDSTFTVSARLESLQSAKPYLSHIIHPDDEILDLCCGSGFVSFWFEELGANVTALDFAPYMIALAIQEAAERNSNVNFIEADIFIQDFGNDCYHLISCFDSIVDFPVSDFAKLSRKIASALKPGGRFVVKYVDTSYKYLQGYAVRQGSFQETPERVTYRIKEYIPDIGAIINTIKNETRQEEYDRKGYIYTPPMVQLAVNNSMKLEKHISLDMDQFLDIYIKSE